MMTLMQKCQTALIDIMNPQGFNMGMNIGHAAGAGIASHLHFHLVPRWGGDTNFMPITAQTKIISESLDDTWKHLTSRLNIK